MTENGPLTDAAQEQARLDEVLRRINAACRRDGTLDFLDAAADDLLASISAEELQREADLLRGAPEELEALRFIEEHGDFSD